MTMVGGRESVVDELMATLFDLGSGAVVFHNRLGLCWVGVAGELGGELAWWQAEVVRGLMRRGLAVIEGGHDHFGQAPIRLTDQGAMLLREDLPVAA
ncbi:hypothetical protein [Actinokineospora diospyrosa]|uniref:ArsR family transcriptional regulator n=1 Tax=Actinokineospora diospyrosa TaxID=103728 RepID=A0ABT1IEJ5_9PSEU|nr:hypothetical protein [Actinokineospora diospyrosa]MCP2271057.1 hypothetical protein [Actinokineospora diospyrosa]